MANPQIESGHIDIANEIAEALMKVNLSPYESRVLWFLFRKTYGWKKKTDWISLSQFSSCLNLDRRLIHRAIKGLSSKKMIVIERDDGQRLNYGFQKDYDKWKVSSKKMTVINRDDEVSSKPMTKLSSKEIPTKDTNTKDNKDNVSKKKPSPLPEDFSISDSVLKWAEKGGYEHLEDHLESFKLSCSARGYEYINFDAAFKKAIREDWAKIAQRKPKKQLDLSEWSMK